VLAHIVSILPPARELDIIHSMFKERSTTSSQPLSRHQDEETADSRRENHKHDQHRERPTVQRLTHKGLADLVEVEEGVLAVPHERDDRIEHVLVCEDEIDGDREGENELSCVSRLCF